MRWRTNGISLVVGAVMATSLVAAHVTDPKIVLGFLDFFGHWNPALTYFMVGSMVSFGLVYRFVRRREVTAFGDALRVPTSNTIDAKLVGGAALFGIGWGMTGLCPGPALASLASGGTSILAFVAAMAVGMLLLDPKFHRVVVRGATAGR